MIRVFGKIRLTTAIYAPGHGAIAGTCTDIPYATEQGNSKLLQGRLVDEQGMF
jgi:hypothetical protein